MKRSSITKVWLSSCCALPLLGFAQKRPHIILIFTDQQNVNAMSAAGNPFLYTPIWMLWLMMEFVLRTLIVLLLFPAPHVQVS